ncbi:MAG: hypothetical protein AB7G39_18050, partial [Alphaproteobacteria bacterium]
MKDVSLKPVDVRKWPEDLKAAMAKSITSDSNTIDLFKVLAVNPPLFMRVLKTFETSLDWVDRETIVVRTLLRCHNHYEKYYHKR